MVWRTRLRVTLNSNHGSVNETVRAPAQQPWFGEHDCATRCTATMVLCHTLCVVTHRNYGLVHTPAHIATRPCARQKQQPWFRRTDLRARNTATMVSRMGRAPRRNGNHGSAHRAVRHATQKPWFCAHACARAAQQLWFCAHPVHARKPPPRFAAPQPWFG